MMKVVECKGSYRKIGETIGETVRDEIKFHISNFIRRDRGLNARIKRLVRTSQQYVPHLVEEMDGMARGANVSVRDIYALNLPGGITSSKLDKECSNVVFKNGPDGPLWGKNNEGLYPPGPLRRPVCVLKLYPRKGIPAVCFSFCGMIMGGDMLNAEGVAVGHSSVGSQYVQSSRFVSCLLWLYDGMLKSRDALAFARHVNSRPLYGKGYSTVVVDRKGRMFSAELACPLVQIRWPDEKAVAMNCVNCFQLPLLKDCTNRSPRQLVNANGRRKFLEGVSQKGNRGIKHLKSILAYHGGYSICRHGNQDGAHTEYSMIGVLRKGYALFLEGYPCQESYRKVTL